ncbi:MAG: PIG-L family deacetylase [Acidimicrobiia bacterium]
MRLSRDTGETPSIDLPVPRRALAIGAHPDDVEFGCAATLAKWTGAGADAQLLVLTDGSKGSWDPGGDPRALVATRHDEQRDAAAALGISEVHFLDLVDGELTGSRAEVAAVCEVIRRVRADVVLGHDPWKRYRLHPDHRHAGNLTIEGIVAARDPHFFPRLGAPHRPDRLLLFEADVVDHVEDIDATFDAKVASLLAHRSQWLSTMGIEAGSDEEGAQRAAFVAELRTVAEVAGALVPDHPVGLGEAFKLIEPL